MSPNTEQTQVYSHPVTLDDLESAAISRDEFWEGSMDDYLAIVQAQPSVAYSAHQRLYHAVINHGVTSDSWAGEPFLNYCFFDDPFDNGKEAIFGLGKPLEKLVHILKAGAARYGQERRIILLHGPVGSSKSTIARLLRKGLAAHTKSNSGKVYTHSWYVEKQSEAYEEIRYTFGMVEQHEQNFIRCPLHEDPLKLLPNDVLNTLTKRLNATKVCLSDEEIELLKPEHRTHTIMRERDRFPEELILLEGELCPFCRFVWRGLLRRYDGDWRQVLKKHVRVERLIFSEIDRMGIGSYTPKDEKNQDSTELSGDINWSKIKYFGSESDPRAFDFNRGEYFVANRGIMYKEEMLKLDKAFLYDDLHVSQDHVVKPKGFALVHLDEVLIGGTNNPEYEQLREDEKMEAFRDRTTRVDIPYVVQLGYERKIYEKTYHLAPGGKHMDPHLIELASLWAVLSRVEDPKDAKLTRMQKVKLYDGQFVGTEFGEDTIKKLITDAGEKEAMQQAISPRYIQDKISNAVVKDPKSNCVTVSLVLQELESGLASHSLIKAVTKREELKMLLKNVSAEYEDILKEEVEQAVSSDEKGITDLFNNYIVNLRAYKRAGTNAKVRNPITNEEEPYSERLMREIEERAGVEERTKDQFRITIMERIAELAMDGKQFDFRSHDKLFRGLRLKLFDDQKDKIKLSTLHTRVIDREEQEKIELIKKRLKEKFGYCDTCATIALHRVASIFARGEAVKK